MWCTWAAQALLLALVPQPLPCQPLLLQALLPQALLQVLGVLLRLLALVVVGVLQQGAGSHPLPAWSW